MKLANTFALTLAVMTAGGCWARAGAEADSPYGTIVKRNMFGLAPLPPAEEPKKAADQTSLPQITLCGTTSILGRRQALFRVAGLPQPGVTARETSHILGAGEKEGEVKVMEISDDFNSVTFDNHGTIQVLQLKAAAAPWQPPETAAVFSGPIPEHFGSDQMILKRMGAPR